MGAAASRPADHRGARVAVAPQAPPRVPRLGRAQQRVSDLGQSRRWVYFNLGAAAPKNRPKSSEMSTQRFLRLHFGSLSRGSPQN
jgi:hypothetical protein